MMGYKTYIIGLNEPVDKIKYIETHGIHPIWFKGLGGKTIETLDRLEYISPFFLPIAPYSAIGCAISHMKVWEAFLKSETEPYALILEDDVIFVEGFKNKFEELLQSQEEHNIGWDLIHLGCFGCDPSAVTLNILEISLKLLGLSSGNKPHVAIGLHAYVVTRDGARKLLQELKGKLWCPIDFGIQSLAAKGKIKRSAYLPRIAFQTSTDELGSSSNVNSQHPRWMLSWLSRFYVDEYLRASYLFGGSILRVGRLHFNLLSLMWFILGYVGAWIGLSTIGLVLGFLFVSICDLWRGDIVGVVVHFILFMVPRVA